MLLSQESLILKEMSNQALAALWEKDTRSQKASDLLSLQICPETLGNLFSSLFLSFFKCNKKMLVHEPRGEGVRKL